MRVRAGPRVSVMDRTKVEKFARLRGQNLMRRSAKGGGYFYKETPQTPPSGNPSPALSSRECGQKTRTPGGRAIGGGSHTGVLRLQSDFLWLSCGTATGSAAFFARSGG